MDIRPPDALVCLRASRIGVGIWPAANVHVGAVVRKTFSWFNRDDAFVGLLAVYLLGDPLASQGPRRRHNWRKANRGSGLPE